MKLPDVPLYKTDFTGKNPANKITNELYQRTAGSLNVIIGLKKGPFFQQSLVLTDLKGNEYVYGKDYVFYGIAKKLTAYIKNDTISIFIKLLNTNISSFYASYQVVGDFSVVSTDLVNLVESGLNNNGPIFFKNIKGISLYHTPTLHQHDLRYEIHSFQDIIDQLLRIDSGIRPLFDNKDKIEIEHFYNTISNYITVFKEAILEYLKTHADAKVYPFDNAHGLTKQTLGLGKVDNLKTATIMQVLEGIRKDLHVTADNVKKLIDSYSKESDSLFKKGLLPIVRYGSNNFIPPSIDGSFEGMGGDDFNCGIGKESDGTWLMLTFRNDGRSKGLYFLKNTTKHADVDKWTFTGYKYQHPQAAKEGIALTNIIRGSTEKFLVVGDGTNWYYAFGNNTFNPDKHQLIKIPTYVKNGNTPRISNAYSYVITSAYPKKVYLLTALTGDDVWGNDDYHSFAYEGYEGLDNSNKSLVTTTDFQAIRLWELDVATNTWRAVVFNYIPVNKIATVKHQVFVPFCYKVKKGYPRADTTDYANRYSLVEARWKFTKGINGWVENWCNVPITKYDSEKERLAIRYFTVGYGYDDRAGTFNTPGRPKSGTGRGTLGSIGFSLENFITNGDVVYCNVINGHGMKGINTLDTTQVGAYDPNNPFEDNLGCAPSVSQTITMIDGGIIFNYGTVVAGSLPADLVTLNLKEQEVWLDYDKFYNNSFYDVPVTQKASIYNETNSIGLSIGGNSSFFFLPKDSVDEYGVCTKYYNPSSKYTMTYRKVAALDANKAKIPPTTNITAYNNPVETYALSNDVRPVDEDSFLTFNTVVLNTNSSNKDKYLKQILSHSTYTRNSNATEISNDTANHLYYESVTFDVGTKLTMVLGKTVDLESIVKGVIGDKLKAYVKANTPDVNIDNYLATYAIVPTCIESNLNDGANYVVFIAFGFDSKGMGYSYSIGLSLGSSVVAGKTELVGRVNGFIGNFVVTPMVRFAENYFGGYRKAGQPFLTFNWGSNIAPRNTIIQQNDGSSIIIAISCFVLEEPSNRYRPGVIINVTKDGVVKILPFDNQWTAGQYYHISHPYYGIGLRSEVVGAAEISIPFADNGVNNYDNIKNHVLNQSKRFLTSSNYISGAFTVYFKASENVTVGGNEYTLPPGYIDLYDVDSSPGNKTFYCYLSHTVTGVNYVISVIPLAESYTQALIGIIMTNSIGIYSIRPQNVFTMNGFRIASTRHGGTIPMATGTISGDGQTASWADNSTDLS